MPDSGQSVDGVDRYCDDCNLVVYDIPTSGDNGTGYLNPDYCPKCGKPIHGDWAECAECGDPIDFKEVNSYAKTRNDERFYHDDCAPKICSVDTATDQEGDR